MTIEEMKDLVAPKFLSVPTVTDAVVERWVNEGVLSHGYTDISEVPTGDKPALLNLIMYIACNELALNAGHYFRWQDGDEMIDKSMIPVQYRQMAQMYLQEYARTSGKSAGKVTWRTIGRADRP